MKSIRNPNMPRAADTLDARVPSDTVNALVLAASTSERDAIPTSAGMVIITSNADIYVKAGNSSVEAAVPSTEVTDGTGSALNPKVFLLDGTHTHIAVISEYACKVTLEYYSVV